MELSGGTIRIDNLDLSTLPRHHIRSRLNAIPQEPYFLAGTIRLNLDPYESSTDGALQAALEKVGLWDAIIALGGLDVDFEVESLSHGQRQFFCLARAILRPGKIVVLDEATSSVDRKTDELMQKIIREEFSSHTLIAVAHRLETIIDFDLIALLDHGALVEFGAPEELLKVGIDGTKTQFKKLYDIYSSTQKKEVMEDEAVETMDRSKDDGRGNE